MPKTVILNSDTDPQAVPVSEKRAPSHTMLRVRQVMNLCEGYLNEIRTAERYYEDSTIASNNLCEVVEALLAQPRQEGDADDFHNLAVTLGSGDFYTLACDVLECGLARYRMNPDLLADYLVFGPDCERVEQCRKYLSVLDSIPQEDWTWRCFSFEILFYKNMLSNFAETREERNTCKQKIDELAHAYKEYLPLDEGGYREVARLPRQDSQRQLELLNDALQNELLGACASCAFSQAEILLQQKRYEEALEALNRSRDDAIHQQIGGINDYKLYFLRALCKNALLLKAGETRPEDVTSIYSDFNIALSGLSGDYQNKISVRATILRKGTGVPIPDDCRDLLELVGD